MFEKENIRYPQLLTCIVPSYIFFSSRLIVDFAEQNNRPDFEISVYDTCLFDTYYNVDIVIIIVVTTFPDFGPKKKVDELS